MTEQKLIRLKTWLAGTAVMLLYTFGRLLGGTYDQTLVTTIQIAVFTAAAFLYGNWFITSLPKWIAQNKKRKQG